MRGLLVAILISGLVPSVAEGVEAVVHLVRTGHLAHGVEDEGDLGELGREHGCGSTDHRCVCCPSLAVAPAPAPVTLARVERSAELPRQDVASPRARSLEPPLRPPIS